MTITLPNAILPFSSSVQFFGPGIQTPLSTPETLTVTQQEFAHDVAEMCFWGGDADSISLISGTPVILSFGRPSGMRMFYGYVNHVTRTNNSLANLSLTERNATSVTCVGASWPMKQTDSKVWFGYTASQVIQEIADLFGLATNIVPDTTVWPSLQMAGMTYWQFCVSLAQKIGYTFYCSGVQLVFKPRQTDPNNLVGGLSAIYDYRHDPATLPIITPTLGATSPAGGQLANRRLAGVDPRTSQVIYAEVAGSPAPTVLGQVADTPVFNKTEHCSVGSQSELNAKVNGAGALNQLYLSATATGVGNQMLSQGSLIFVQNANGSQNGLWFVEQTVHTLNPTTYVMDLQLGRDSLGATASISSPIQTQSLPNAVLSGQQAWVAA